MLWFSRYLFRYCVLGQLGDLGAVGEGADAVAVLVHLGLLGEDYTNTLDVPGSGELPGTWCRRGAERHLERSQSVDLDAVGLLEVVTDYLYHLGEDGEGIGLLRGGVVLDALCDFVETYGVERLCSCVPHSLVSGSVAVVLVKFVEY